MRRSCFKVFIAGHPHALLAGPVWGSGIGSCQVVHAVPTWFAVRVACAHGATHRLDLRPRADAHASRPAPLADQPTPSPHPSTVIRTKDNRVCVLAIPKAEPGEHWSRLFRGDSHGARCMQPPYTLSGAVRCTGVGRRWRHARPGAFHASAVRTHCRLEGLPSQHASVCAPGHLMHTMHVSANCAFYMQFGYLLFCRDAGRCHHGD